MKHETSRGGMWRALFEKHHSQLTEVAEILLHRSGSPEEIVRTAFAELEHRSFYEPFGKISAVRAVVKAAVGHNYMSVDSWILTTPSGAINDEHPGPQPLEALSWAERAVYFLHEVLHYSQRDIALLLGISDAHVDELNWFPDRERLKSLSSPGVSIAFRSRFWCTCTRSKLLSPLQIIARPKHMAEFCVDSGMFLGIGIIFAVTRCCPADRKKDWGPQLRHFDRGSIKLKGEVDYGRLARIISCILSSTSANHRDPMQV